MDANDSTMENLSLYPLDFYLRENFEEHYLDLNDQIVEGDDLQLEDLILNHSLEENDFIMENLSCEDIFYFFLRENFEENQSIFEVIPELTLENPTLGIDLISSSFQMLHKSSF